MRRIEEMRISLLLMVGVLALSACGDVGEELEPAPAPTTTLTRSAVPDQTVTQSTPTTNAEGDIAPLPPGEEETTLGEAEDGPSGVTPPVEPSGTIASGDDGEVADADPELPPLFDGTPDLPKYPPTEPLIPPPLD